MSQHNGNSTSLRLKTGLAEMLKGGVIMDVTNAEQAAIAENAGAVSVMALERDDRLLGIGDVHNDAALQHFSEAGL